MSVVESMIDLDMIIITANTENNYFHCLIQIPLLLH